MVFPYNHIVKTTLNIQDELYRRAKSKAALMGIPLGRFLERSLERTLNEDPKNSSGSWSEWATRLPEVPQEDLEQLNAVIGAPDFRAIDKDMWE